MKFVKGLIALLTISSVFAMGNANAAYRTYSNIKLSNWSGTYSNGPITKTTGSSQSVHTIDARDTISNDVRAVEARTVGESKTSLWISVPKGAVTSWDRTTANGNTAAGAYNINLRASKSTLTGTYYWGTWNLDN